MHISLNVSESANISRNNEVVSVGVPFPRGLISPQTTLAAQAADGQLAPTQWRPLTGWPDGSVQRALVHFLADSQARAQALWRLVEAPAPAPPQPVRWTHQAGLLTVDTGRLQVTMKSHPFHLFNSLAAGGTPVIQESAAETGPVSGLFTVDPQQRVHAAAFDPAVTITLEEAGPLRLVVRCQGRHLSRAGELLLDFEMRLQFSAGSNVVKGYHTVINRCATPSVAVAEIGLALPVAGLAGAMRPTQNRYGQLECRGRQGKVSVVMEHYDEQGPKKMECGAGRLAVWFLPPAPEALTLQQGIAKTHILHFGFFTPEQESERLLWSALRPVQVTVSCDWMNQTGVMSPILPRQPKKYPWLELILQDSFRWAWANLPAEFPDLPFNQRDFYCKRLYGLLDFGDYSRDGRRFCQHLEHDFPHVMFLQYLRLEDEAYREAMEETVLHMLDVDVCHYRAPDPDYKGCYVLGGLYEHDRLHNSPHIRMSLSHVWLEGILDYYYLTGSARALEVAKGIADNVVCNIPRFYRQKTLARHHGWPLVALTAIYRATGDARYLDACEDMLSWLREWRDASGCFSYAGGTGPFAVNHNRPFGVGVLLKGLTHYYRLKPGDALREFILTSVDAALRAYESPEGLLRSPEFKGYEVMMETVFMLDVLALAFEMTGNQAYLEKGLFNFKYALWHWLQYDQMRDTLRLTSLLHAIFPFLYVADQAGLLTDIRPLG